MTAAAVAFYTPAGNGKVKTNDTLGTWIVNTGSMSLGTVTFVEGTGAISDKVSANTRTAYDITAADLTGEQWDFSSGGADDGEHIVVWVYMYEGWDSLANGGFGIIAADDAAADAFGTWYLGPQAGYIGGWYPLIVDPAKDFDAVTAGTAGWTQAGNPDQLTAVDGFGARWKVLSTISGATDNCYMDAIIVGQGYQVTLGDAGSTECAFSDFVTYEENVNNRYGFLRPVSGIPFMRGKLIIGATSGAANTEFIDSGFTVVWEKVTIANGSSSAVRDGFYELRFSKGSGTTDVTMSQGVLKAVSPHTVVLDFAGATSATLTGVNVDRGGAISLDSAVTWTNSVINNSGQIDGNGAVFTGNSVGGSTVAADESALLWDVADGDPDGNLDNCTFTRHASTLHHAISLTPNAATTNVTFRGITVTGFSTDSEASASTDNDTVLELEDRGADTTWNINKVGCSGIFSWKRRRSGDTVNIISDPVTLTVTVVDLLTGDPIEDVNVLVEAAAGGSLSVGTDIIKDFTDVSGEVADTRTYASDQPITGRARFASSPGPYYKTGAIAGTVDSASDTNITVQMILDT